MIKCHLVDFIDCHYQLNKTWWNVILLTSETATINSVRHNGMSSYWLHRLHYQLNKTWWNVILLTSLTATINPIRHDGMSSCWPHRLPLSTQLNMTGDQSSHDRNINYFVRAMTQNGCLIGRHGPSCYSAATPSFSIKSTLPLSSTKHSTIWTKVISCYIHV